MTKERADGPGGLLLRRLGEHALLFVGDRRPDLAYLPVPKSGSTWVGGLARRGRKYGGGAAAVTSDVCLHDHQPPGLPSFITGAKHRTQSAGVSARLSFCLPRLRAFAHRSYTTNRSLAIPMSTQSLNNMTPGRMALTARSSRAPVASQTYTFFRLYQQPSLMA